MAIDFHCDQCGRALQAADDHAGRHGKCKHCGHSVVVPGLSAAAEQPLHLEPLESTEPPRAPVHLLSDHESLKFQIESTASPAASSDPNAIDGVA